MEYLNKALWTDNSYNNSMMDECVGKFFLKKRHNLSRFVHYLLKKQTYSSNFKTLQLTLLQISGSYIFLRKYSLGEYIWAHWRKYIFVLMNTECTYTTYISILLLLSLNDEKKKDKLVNVASIFSSTITDDSCSVNANWTGTNYSIALRKYCTSTGYFRCDNLYEGNIMSDPEM